MKFYLYRSWSILLQSVSGASRSLCLFVLLTHSTHAIIDTNNNGLSDLWEKTYNNGALFTSGITAQQDSDSDGWTNEKEAAAGTNPFIANPPEGIIQPQTERIPATYLGVDANGDPAILTPETQTVTWPTLVGKQYTLQFSPNLQSGTWLDVGSPILGEGTDITIANVLTQPDGSVPERLFWRVVATDLDADSDGLTNAEEHQLGTNSNAADSDGDTLNDKAEYLAGTNPLSTDSDLDGLADNVDSTPLANNAEADPDGAGLDPSLETNLIGRWDFEKIAAGGGLESTPASVGAFDIANTNASWDGINNWANEVKGMPWAAVHFTQPGAYGKLPASRFHLKSTETWAMWIKFPASALDNSNAKRTLFSLGKYLTASDNSRLPVLHAYFDGTGATSSLNLETYWIGSNFPHTSLAAWPTPANLDDGNWHHLAVTFGSGLYELYFDGVRTNFTNSNPLTINLVQTGSSPYALLGRYINSPPPGYETLGASLDRLRIYQYRLPVASILALYNQDIDRDGLFDRIEQLGRMWRDTNSNCVREAVETYYPVNPFRWVPTGTDTDGDGLGDHDEQTRGTSLTNPDTDGDLMPDGWEVLHGLNPLSSNDANLDNDIGGADGLTNINEYRYNTDPTKRDTDGDGTNDGPEAKGPDGNLNTDDGSDPADGTDGGNRLPDSALIAFKLGVGDRSSSHSEDYVLNVFRHTSSTGLEERVFTLRSGGFGQYAETTHSFKKNQLYTFQIQWMGTSNNTNSSPSEGPDWDYHLVIETQGINIGILADGYDSTTKILDPAIRLRDPEDINPSDDDNDDVADFPNTLSKKRVIYIPVSFERDEDVADGNWQPLTGQLTKALPGQKMNLRLRVQQLPTRMMISALQWIMPEGSFKDYTANRDHGVLTQMAASDLNRADVSFYMADTGSKMVKFKFKLNGEDQELKCVLDIQKPDSTFTTSFGNIGFSTGQFTPYFYAGLYETPGMQGGIEFKGKVIMPAGWPDGKWNWVQIVNKKRTKTTFDGVQKSDSFNGKQGLDTSYPYAPSPSGSHPGNAGGYQTGSEHINSDSPAVLLTGYSGASADDQFVMFLMFLPNGQDSRFVPLRSVAWKWNVTVTKNSNGNWIITSSNPDKTADPSVENRTHPTWDLNAADGVYPP